MHLVEKPYFHDCHFWWNLVQGGRSRKEFIWRSRQEAQYLGHRSYAHCRLWHEKRLLHIENKWRSSWKPKERRRRGEGDVQVQEHAIEFKKLHVRIRSLAYFLISLPPINRSLNPYIVIASTSSTCSTVANLWLSTYSSIGKIENSWWNTMESKSGMSSCSLYIPSLLFFVFCSVCDQMLTN